jgi:hypothetical protein
MTLSPCTPTRVSGRRSSARRIGFGASGTITNAAGRSWHHMKTTGDFSCSSHCHAAAAPWQSSSCTMAFIVRST